MASNGKQVSMRDVSPGAAGVSLAAVSHGVNGGPPTGTSGDPSSP